VSNTDPNVLAASQARTSHLLRRILPNLKKLSIGLRLPLAAYEAPAAAGESPCETSLVSTWKKLPLALGHLSGLRRLNIWLDHEGFCSWSVVNERAVLFPLASLSSNPDLTVTIDLPILHPDRATADRHFTENSPPLPFAIHRRYRQRYHGVRNWKGNLCTRWSPDFPYVCEPGDFGGDCTGLLELENLTPEEWEDFLNEVPDYLPHFPTPTLQQ
jgi:hypothetical protein